MEEARRLLREAFGHSSFKSELQAAVVEALVGGAGSPDRPSFSQLPQPRDVLVCMPTGGGKSLCYQLPGLVRGGVTVVVSPLIALMEDQVRQLHALGLSATVFNGTLPAAEIERILGDLHATEARRPPQVRFLYTTPESLLGGALAGALRHLYSCGQLALMCIDEAHCVSEWGHDFRPAFARLGRVRARLPKVPFIAVTATATSAVQRDIVNTLGLVDVRVFRSPCARPNLRLEVALKDHLGQSPFADLVEFIKAVGAGNGALCGIVYELKRDGCEALATMLSAAGIPSLAYHGGMGGERRRDVQAQWLGGLVNVGGRVMGRDTAGLNFHAVKLDDGSSAMRSVHYNRNNP